MSPEYGATFENNDPVELPPPVPARGKGKSPVLGAVLGFFFGPFSTLYFGWRVLLSTLIVVFLTTTAIALLIPFHFPRWFPWAVSLFYTFWNPMLAFAHNAAMETTEPDAPSLAALNFIGMQGWYIRYATGIMGVYAAFLLINKGRWGLAILALFVLMPLIVMVFESVMAFILAIIMTAFERRSR